jgi:poly(A) polymerase
MNQASEPALLGGATSVIQTLKAAGHLALLAGGCVRDSLLGKTAKDYDVATSARPEEVIRLFPGALTVGAHFGVVIVRQGGHHFEVATFRTDGSYSDGRRPDTVTFATAKEDAQRRDFTANGLFLDPLTGEIIDYVGGLADLEARVLRAIGDAHQRFAEDHLRLLRAVRFATVLGFEVEPQTWKAVREMAPRIQAVSAERIRDELTKIFVHRNRLRGFDLLVESGLMEAVLPEILALQGCEQPAQFHPEGDVFIHTRLMLSLLPDEVSLPLVLSVLLGKNHGLYAAVFSSLWGALLVGRIDPIFLVISLITGFIAVYVTIQVRRRNSAKSTTTTQATRYCRRKWDTRSNAQ